MGGGGGGGGGEMKRSEQRMKESERTETGRRSKYKKTPASVCQRDTPMVYTESPSLQRLTNDSPGLKNWLKGKTSAPTDKMDRNKF